MKTSENTPKSNTGTPTIEEMTEIINRTRADCAEMREIALSAVGKNIYEVLSRATKSTGSSSRFDTAFELMCAALEIKTIVKILLIDSFWLDDPTEKTVLRKGSRRDNKSEFMYVVHDFANVCADIEDMIKGA